ncbi:HupE/UreJ family protein [Crenalkalicoccus roseus]|uniref:HupE/UreJ family protein n=1 Tax=Crenalkalicoccus roseus TaxID=1485588 RepID=UPI00195807F1|nr:HupE/UreJ family protein [Crenalkalicoccus roseus]
MTAHPARPLALMLAAAALPRPASAHHAMDGAAPGSWAEGLLSGLAHPVIGLDHLAFVVAAGVLAATVGRAGRALPLLFLGAGLAGTLLHLGGIGLGPVEAAVALSALAAGALLLRRGPAPPAPALAGLFGLAGLFHGHAYAEAVVGAQAGPILAYLAGLLAVQAAIAYGAMALARRAGEGARLRRWAGASACVVGAVAGALALLA